MMATAITVTGKRLRDGGRLSSGFSANKNYLVSAIRRLSTSRDMALVAPQAAAGALAAWRWADTSTPYRFRPSWRGGEPGFKATLFAAPIGATFGGIEFTGTPIENEFTRTLDLTTGLYVHTMPDNFCLCEYQFQPGDLGQQFHWGMMVQDQDNRILPIHWVTGVSDSNVKYFDSASGNNANAGTFAAPYQTAAFGYALANAQNFIFKFKDGNYVVDSDFSITASKSASWIAVGSNVNFNMDAGFFSGGVNDMTFMGIKHNGARLAAANAFNHKYNLVDRAYFYDCVFNNSFSGSARDDNPAAIAFWGNASLEHHDISIVNCTQPSTAKCQLLVTFDVNGLIVENCHADNVTYDAGNGSKFIHIKDETSNFTVRFCTVSGTSIDGLFAISNQGAENNQCNNQDVQFCAANSNGATSSSGPFTWNNQSSGNPCKGTSQFFQRCTVVAGTQVPLWFRSLGTGGEPVNTEAALYSSSSATFIDGGATAATQIGTPSVKVAAGKINADFSYADDIKAANLGVTGHIIASELVS